MYENENDDTVKNLNDSNNNFVITQKTIDALCEQEKFAFGDENCVFSKWQHDDRYKKYASFMLKIILENKLQIPQNAFKYFMKFNDLDMFQPMLICGFKASQNTLKIACERSADNFVKIILDNDIKPTEECYDILIKNATDNLKTISCYNMRYRSPSAPKIDKYKLCEKDLAHIAIIKCANLLIEYGYVPTYDAVKKSIGECITVIPNFNWND